MEITLSLKDIGLLLIGIGIIILIIYLIVLVRNLVTSVKLSNKILEDSQAITAIAAARAVDLDAALDDVTKTVGTVTEAIRGNQSAIKALSVLINSLGAVRSLLSRGEEKE